MPLPATETVAAVSFRKLMDEFTKRLIDVSGTSWVSPASWAKPVSVTMTSTVYVSSGRKTTGPNSSSSSCRVSAPTPRRGASVIQ